MAHLCTFAVFTKFTFYALESHRRPHGTSLMPWLHEAGPGMFTAFEPPDKLGQKGNNVSWSADGATQGRIHGLAECHQRERGPASSL